MKPLFFLFLGNSFLVKERVKELVRKISESYSAEISPQSFDLNETPFTEIVPQAKTLPFLAPAQIFILKNASALKKESVEEVGQYLGQPSDTTYLIFTAESLGRQKQLATLIEKSGKVITCEDRDKHAAGNQFIREKLQAAGKTMSPQAARRLQETAGNVPEFLDSVLEQLIIYSDKQKEITEEMVEIFEDKLVESDAFKLTNLIAAKNTGEALRVLTDLLGGSDREIIPLLGLLHWQLRRLWLGRTYMDQGLSESAVLKRCGVYPKQAPYFLRQVKQYKKEQLEKAVEGLFQLDWKFKSGRLQGVHGLEAWLVETTA